MFMLGFLKNIFDDNKKRINSYSKIIEEINGYEKTISKLTDTKLKAKTAYFKALLEKGNTLDHILPEAFAVVREAIKRTVGERAYDVQLMSALTLHQGAIAEQRTGEGKTHSVIFPAYLNALTGKGVHIITPNDYLTRVGTGWYPKALNLLDVSTAGMIHEASFMLDTEYTDPSEKFDSRLTHLRPISRKEAYLADVTYGTNNEFGFDYLRDHMVSDFNDMVQRPYHNFAIVDEVDFVLIDEARTPLIISSPNNQPTDKYYKFAQIAAKLQPTDYVIDEKARSATLSEFGIRKVEQVLGVKNLYEESFETIHYIENAIKAQALFHKDRDYVIKDGEIIIVDEFTGRLMNGRRWSDGLHQAVEAKENVTVQRESQTWATITFQNYFRLYDKLSGMTGTAATESEEFKKIYDLDVIIIPTNKEIKRKDSQDLIFKSQRDKYAAVAAKVKELNKLGQPVLIGTTSIDKNNIISSLLQKQGVPHQVLNAKNHRSEAEIIAKAGKIGAVTVATNMAGRGVDIVLGGPKENADPKLWQTDHDKVIELGGLYVIGTERHESRRIDNQLRGRGGRQGDPGYSQFYVALDDDLMRIFGGEKIASLMTRFNMPDNEALTHPLVSKVIEQIQVKVEGYNFDVRKSLVEYDDVINKQRQIIYKLRDNTLQNPSKEEVFKYLEHQVTPENFLEILPSPKIPKGDLMDLLKKEWQRREDYFGADIAKSIMIFAIISTIDPLWVDHLTALDDLRDGVRLRGYAQKDPLIEYRKEGFEMFQDLMGKFEYNLARKLFRLEPTQNPINVPKNVTEARGELESDTPETKTPVTKTTVSRNDPCPCGSNKKYKKCCYPKFG